MVHGTMGCECGQVLAIEYGKWLETYRKHQETHPPLTQAEWSKAYHSIQAAKDKYKKDNDMR